MPGSPLDKIQLNAADDRGPKCACILLLDTSGSMSGTPISLLNEGLVEFQRALESQDIVQYRVDLAVITFGSGVQLAIDFVPAAEFQAATLTAEGSTPMGAAICQALDMLEDRKEHYRVNGNSVYRPWVLMITDGGPTDDWQEAARRVKEAEARKSCVFYAVGVEGADFDKLGQIAVRRPMRLKGLAFGELFVWLSDSLGGVSKSKPGDKLTVQPPDRSIVDFTID